MKSENNDVMDTLKSLLSALDIVAFERVGEGQFQVIGSLTGWFVRMRSESSSILRIAPLKAKKARFVP